MSATHLTAMLAQFSMTSISSSQSLGLLLGVGLGVLTVSLLILMRTRWGQAKPLSKCVALSVFAHILLFGYAYATKLMLDSPHPYRDDVIQFTLDDPQAYELETTDQVQPEPEPWDRYADAPAPEPGVTLEQQPLRLPAAAEASLPQTAVAANVLSEASLSLAEAVEEAVQRPDVAAPKVPEPQRASAPAPLAIAPAAAPQNERVADKPPTPDVAGPERLEAVANVAESTSSVTRSPTPEPASMLAIASQLQRLLDEPNALDAENADAAESAQETVAANQVGRAPRGQLASAVANTGSGGARTANLATAAAGAEVARRIGDGEPLPKLFQSRVGKQRSLKVQQHGGSEKTEQAVERALEWLARNQSASGAWVARDFGAGQGGDRGDGQDRDLAGADADTGVTGLALLAFLGHGDTHVEGPYRDHVLRGLQYLLDQQRSDGNLAGEARLYAKMYCHGMATLALSEAWAMTGDSALQGAVQRAVQYTVESQHPTTGGWRYQPGDKGDMSQFGWQLISLKSASLAGVPTPASTRSGMVRFLRSVSNGRARGLAGYRPGDGPSRTMTAEALLCRVMLGEANRPAAIQEATDFILEDPPRDGQANLYYWYYGSLAMFQVQGEPWRRWNQALTKQLTSRQRSEGALNGSWDPDTRWGAYGGRVYSTAMAALSLEVYYRYLPVMR